MRGTITLTLLAILALAISAQTTINYAAFPHNLTTEVFNRSDCGYSCSAQLTNELSGYISAWIIQGSNYTRKKLSLKDLSCLAEDTTSLNIYSPSSTPMMGWDQNGSVAFLTFKANVTVQTVNLIVFNSNTSKITFNRTILTNNQVQSSVRLVGFSIHGGSSGFGIAWFSTSQSQYSQSSTAYFNVFSKTTGDRKFPKDTPISTRAYQKNYLTMAELRNHSYLITWQNQPQDPTLFDNWAAAWVNSFGETELSQEQIFLTENSKVDFTVQNVLLTDSGYVIVFKKRNNTIVSPFALFNSTSNQVNPQPVDLTWANQNPIQSLHGRYFDGLLLGYQVTYSNKDVTTSAVIQTFDKNGQVVQQKGKNYTLVANNTDAIYGVKGSDQGYYVMIRVQGNDASISYRLGKLFDQVSMWGGNYSPFIMFTLMCLILVLGN